MDGSFIECIFNTSLCCSIIILYIPITTYTDRYSIVVTEAVGRTRDPVSVKSPAHIQLDFDDCT